MMDKKYGIWLLHSTPRFPYKKESNSFYPDSGETNGQTFICVTFPYATFQAIGNVPGQVFILYLHHNQSLHSLSWNVFLFSGEHLQDINIHSFDHYLPPWVHHKLRKAADMFRVPEVPKTTFRNLKSKSGNDFRSFVQDQNEGEINIFGIHVKQKKKHKRFIQEAPSVNPGPLQLPRSKSDLWPFALLVHPVSCHLSAVIWD